MDAITVGILVVEAALLVVLYAAHVQGNTAAVINTLAAISITVVPVAIDETIGISASQPPATVAGLTLIIAVAGLLHSLGMLGLYESTSWWDHLTHTVSAALAAALLYAGLLVWTSNEILAAVGTVLTIFGLGIGWELLELALREVGERYDIEPALVHYGWRDTALDLVFDLIGALLVVMLDVRLFVPTLESVLTSLGLA